MLLGPSILPFFPLRKKTHFLGTSQEGVEPQFFCQWELEDRGENGRVGELEDLFLPRSICPYPIPDSL